MPYRGRWTEIVPARGWTVWHQFLEWLPLSSFLYTLSLSQYARNATIYLFLGWHPLIIDWCRRCYCYVIIVFRLFSSSSVCVVLCWDVIMLCNRLFHSFFQIARFVCNWLLHDMCEYVITVPLDGPACPCHHTHTMHYEGFEDFLGCVRKQKILY